MLAKITSELGKPAGLVVLSREDALERFAAESPGLVPGIGPKTVIKLQGMGIHTLADLRGREREQLEAAFGPRSGAWLHARGRLWDETPITVSRETKSQSVETTFDVDVRDRGRARVDPRRAGRGALPAARASASSRAARSGSRSGSTTGPTSPARRPSRQPTNDPAVVAPVALELLRAYDPQRPVRLLGVRVASFESEADAEPPTARAEPQLRGSACRPTGPRTA